MPAPHCFPLKLLLLRMILQSQALVQVPPMGWFKSATENLYLLPLKDYTRVLCVNPPTSILKLGRGHIPRKDGRETAVDYVGPTQLANVLCEVIIAHQLMLVNTAVLTRFINVGMSLILCCGWIHSCRKTKNGVRSSQLWSWQNAVQHRNWTQCSKIYIIKCLLI